MLAARLGSALYMERCVEWGGVQTWTLTGDYPDEARLDVEIKTDIITDSLETIETGKASHHTVKPGNTTRYRGEVSSVCFVHERTRINGDVKKRT